MPVVKPLIDEKGDSHKDIRIQSSKNRSRQNSKPKPSQVDIKSLLEKDKYEKVTQELKNISKTRNDMKRLQSTSHDYSSTQDLSSVMKLTKMGMQSEK